MKIKPRQNNILIKRLQAETKTSGGIIIPDTAQDKPQHGEVIAVGPGLKNDNGQLISVELKVGDKVLFTKWSGTEVKVGGEEMLLMKETDILATIE